MIDDEKFGRIPDDFWDLSSLIPKKTLHVPAHRPIDTVEIDTCPEPQRENTVIERMIPPRGAIPKREEYTEVVLSYFPENSLLHEVTVKKRKFSYPFYEEFYRDALRYRDMEGTQCEYVAFFSYSPQYNQLNDAQLAYYFWWRSNARQEIYLKTDYSYVLLYAYELINLGAEANANRSLEQLTSLWNEYHESMPSLNAKLATWICDFGLIHKLPPASNAGSALVQQMGALKEYYISMPNGDVEGCVHSLLKYCTAYDYRSSKFAKGENLALFDFHVPRALQGAVEYFSEDGKMLSRLAGEDSELTREAYAGALCAAREKYQISVRYCSFSRTNELRYLVGDMIKYAENKLRAFLGVKSRLSVYSLSSELQGILDRYFEQALANRARPIEKKREKQEYDVLYDLPKKEFSLSDAQKIEQESWETTHELLDAFEERETTVSFSSEPFVADSILNEKDETTEDFCSLLGEFLVFANAVLEKDQELQRKEAERLGKMPEAIVDEINEKAIEHFGDILIEDGEDGFDVIDCYRDILCGGTV